MAKKSVSTPDEGLEALRSLEADLGESLVFRSTGRILAASGWENVPLNSWGLVALTPTRVIFHHFPNTHPLIMKKDAEVRWTAERSRFDLCAAVRQAFWTKLVSGVPDHVSLTGPGVSLIIELADFPKAFVEGWGASPPGLPPLTLEPSLP